MRPGRGRLILVAGAALCAAAPARAQLRDAAELESMLDAQIDAAEKYSQPIREAPASISVITADDIRDHGFRTLTELLVHAQEFYLAGTGFDTRVGVRGLSRLADMNSRVLVLLDDHAMNDGFYGSAPFGTDFGVPLDAVERVEVIRGPGSSLYGSNAMLAVIRVVTKSGAAVDGGQVRAEGGLPNRGAASLVYGKELGRYADLLVTGSWSNTRADTWYLPGLNVEEPTLVPLVAGETRERHRDAFVSLRLNEVYLRALLSRRDKDLWPSDPALADETWDRDRIQSFVEVGRRWRVGSTLDLQVRGFHDRIENAETVVSPGTVVDFATRGKWLGMEAQFGWDAGAWGRLTGGAEYRNNVDAVLTAPGLGGDYHVNAPDHQLSLFSQVEVQPLPTLSLVGGLRADRYSDQGTGVTPRLAVVFYPTSGTTLKLISGQAYRAPNVFELNSQVLVGIFRRGRSLDGEEITTSEVLLEQRLARGVYGTVSAYRHRTGTLIDVVVDSATRRVSLGNVPGVEGRGVALGLRARFASGVGATTSYVWQRTEDVATGAPVTDAPRRMVRFGLAAPLVGRTTAAVDVVHDGPQSMLDAPEVDAQTVVGLGVSGARFLGPFGFSAHVRNLFDEQVAVPGSISAGGRPIPQEGRSLRVSLTARL